MKQFVPDYYTEFACIKGDCRHSCCIGWEIDIDSDSLVCYQNIGGEMGIRLASSIVTDGEDAHFRLTKDERCPFLNSEGLCDLILNLGKDCLCQICDDHPRFRNFYSDREETGLGLCCEAAGRLVLQRSQPVQWILLEDDGTEEELYDDEAVLLQFRDELTTIAQDRRFDVDARAARILQAAELPNFDMRFKGRSEFLLRLERLDNAWAQQLKTLDDSSRIHPLPDDDACTLALEQLLVYLLWRHLPAALDDGDMRGRIAFILFIWNLLRDMIAMTSEKRGIFELEDAVELARLCSSEIEYSDENIDAIIDELHSHFPEL